MTIEERAHKQAQEWADPAISWAVEKELIRFGKEQQAIDNINGVGMNLYVSKYKGGFGGGLIVVAAFSQEDALEVAAKEARHDYYFKDWSHERNEWYTKLDSSMSPFEKIEGGRYYGDPCVVVESIYSE